MVQPCPPPLPCVNKYNVYTYTVCKGGVRGSGSPTDKHLPHKKAISSENSMGLHGIIALRCLAWQKTSLETADITLQFMHTASGLC
jgi:hypothetical protein